MSNYEARGPQQESYPGDDPVSLYLQEIGKVPLLTGEEEQMLGQAIFEGAQARLQLEEQSEMLTEEEQLQYQETLMAGDQAAEHMVQANLRLVVSVARRYAPHAKKMSILDLIQEGNLGLMHAAEKFDYRKGFKFSTYATPWIRQAVSRGLSDQNRTIRLPVQRDDELRALHKAERAIVQDYGRTEADDETLKQQYGYTDQQLARVRSHDHAVASLDKNIGHDDSSMTLGDVIASPQAEDEYEQVLNFVESDMLAQLYDTAELTAQETQILNRRFGFVDGHKDTLDAVGKDMGVSRERIRQIQSAALKKLRNAARFHPEFSEEFLAGTK